MDEDEKELHEFNMLWGKYHNQKYGRGEEYSRAKFYFFEALRTLREKIKSDPSIGKLVVEDWPESPDY